VLVLLTQLKCSLYLNKKYKITTKTAKVSYEAIDVSKSIRFNEFGQGKANGIFDEYPQGKIAR
jgi:hypothetical protein